MPCFNQSLRTPLQILALRLLQAVLPSWDKTERSQDMKFLVEKLFGFLGSLLSTCSSDLPLLRGTVHLFAFLNVVFSHFLCSNSLIQGSAKSDIRMSP